MKKLLIVVDYQNDFVTGALGFPEAAALEDAIHDKVQQYLDGGDDVVYTMDTHGEDYSETQEGKKLPVPHCLCGSEGWQLHGRLRYQLAYCPYFEKNTFGSTDLLHFLESKTYDSIELVGVVSNICVISNAVLAKAAQPEADIVVDAGCVASNDKAMQEKAFDVMENLHIRVIKR
ncbi:cysteine hydrolase family protein [Anaeromassilibacillus senegalensis]|uniref:cysteine hydrolase family protein n=1 Tax=Anaeromassilibacillus senegalensis TaxID=1673717 RepID=UPI000682BC8C|nr:isochorismatase family cysteine hydrolase [Anaeromassilibacillus senegalensis]